MGSEGAGAPPASGASGGARPASGCSRSSGSRQPFRIGCRLFPALGHLTGVPQLPVHPLPHLRDLLLSGLPPTAHVQTLQDGADGGGQSPASGRVDAHPWSRQLRRGGNLGCCAVKRAGVGRQSAAVQRSSLLGASLPGDVELRPVVGKDWALLPPLQTPTTRGGARLLTLPDAAVCWAGTCFTKLCWLVRVLLQVPPASPPCHPTGWAG